jgi:hypothetical protein
MRFSVSVFFLHKSVTPVVLYTLLDPFQTFRKICKYIQMQMVVTRVNDTHDKRGLDENLRCLGKIDS